MPQNTISVDIFLPFPFFFSFFFSLKKFQCQAPLFKSRVLSKSKLKLLYTTMLGSKMRWKMSCPSWFWFLFLFFPYDYKITVCISGNTNYFHLRVPLGHNFLMVETCAAKQRNSSTASVSASDLCSLSSSLLMYSSRCLSKTNSIMLDFV